MLFYSLSIIMLLVTFRDGVVSLPEILIFLLLYAIYIVAVINWKKIFKYKEDDVIEIVTEELEKKNWKKIFAPIDWLVSKTFPKAHHHIWIFSISIIWIILLSWVLVESAVIMAAIMGVPSVII
jgi:Ca2+/Na+ antiporter